MKLSTLRNSDQQHREQRRQSTLEGIRALYFDSTDTTSNPVRTWQSYLGLTILFLTTLSTPTGHVHQLFILLSGVWGLLVSGHLCLWFLGRLYSS